MKAVKLFLLRRLLGFAFIVDGFLLVFGFHSNLALKLFDYILSCECEE